MKPYFVMFTPILTLVCLSACDRPEGLAKLCKNNPQICHDLHQDSWCKLERRVLIDQRLALIEQVSVAGEQQFQLLLALEGYNRCLEIFANVEHIMTPERTQERTKAFVDSSQTLAELQSTTRDNSDPYLSYYHWLRFGDKAAFDRLEQQYQQRGLPNAILVAALGAYYEKFDPARATTLYLAALAQSEPQDFNPSWLLGLANSNQRLNNREANYLFIRTHTYFSELDVNESQLLAILGDNPIDIKRLNMKAAQLATLLNDGDYPASTLRRELESQTPAP
ncbi:DUF2989 domain-containing protein [Shewanella sp. NIFS-20-20]|uniref:DUF2989 domain-containing protein n=1 Tax=Shewanella sp. NIFS-20-20 TaxID=2853806 RepID=UPI001C455D05|nr:DUF2989 domain-containing protein [Shewanella sp. NIFS-20-20]MBV7316340.1 DUF2989 domain-containing protein [Shewanella sp. NIFS-20-20]